MGKRESPQQVVLGILDNYIQRMKLDHLLTSYTKINSTWIKDINVEPEPIKILEESTGFNSSGIGCNIFLYMCSEARETKAKINYWDYIKKKHLCTAKKTTDRKKKTTYLMGGDI